MCLQVALNDSTGCTLNGSNIEESDYVSSVSRCESERGTYGRGTPPAREVGQPRLDELLRKIQVIFCVSTEFITYYPPSTFTPMGWLDVKVITVLLFYHRNV